MLAQPIQCVPDYSVSLLRMRKVAAKFEYKLQLLQLGTEAGFCSLHRIRLVYKRPKLNIASEKTN